MAQKYVHPRESLRVQCLGDEWIECNCILHFEADKATNDALLAYFRERAFEIHAELGPRVEIEQWTNSWSRVHEVVPYTALDADLADLLAKKLSRMISVLQPMLEKKHSRRRQSARAS